MLDSLYEGSAYELRLPMNYVLIFLPINDIGAVPITIKLNCQLAVKAMIIPDIKDEMFYNLNPIIVDVRL